MGSSGSRPSAPAADTADDSKRVGKNKQNFLVPFLRSMSCGTSSSWRTDTFEDTHNREGSNEHSCDKVPELTDPTPCNGHSSNIVDSASLSPFGHRHRYYHKAERQATSISRLESSFDAHTSSDECLTTTYISHEDLSSNQSICEGHEVNVALSLASVSRVEGTSSCMPEQENSANSAESERLHQNGSSIVIDTSSAQDTVSSEYLDYPVSLQNEASGLVAQALDDFSISRGELSGREARRNNGRRLWDALTRASSRRRRLSPSFVQADEDFDGSRTSNDDWGLFDWSSSELSSSFPHGSDALSRRISSMEERRWRARPQALAFQHFSDSMGGSSGQSRYCAFGRHPNGYCSCEAFVMTDESSTRASISRIVMLAEALFEVLDEIHRQSVTLSRSTSLSLVSSPAPEAVVDSFAVRVHKKSDSSVSVRGQCAECYICLVEYEEGDRIRVLPCCHEFHMACVDRWLKEAHRLCPLCRRNVCEEAVST